MHAREPASFWWKNVTVVVMPLRGLARMSCGNRLSNVRRLTILRSGKVFTSSNKDNTANFYGEKKCNEAILFSFFFFDNNQKIFRSNLVLEVVFVPESEGLYYLAVADPGEPVPTFTFWRRGGPVKVHQDCFSFLLSITLTFDSVREFWIWWRWK